MTDFLKSSLTDWENLVKKQLKTEDLSSLIKVKSDENISILPYYHQSEFSLSLQKKEENTHLVADYQSDLENDVFAFIVQDSLPVTSNKNLFTSQLSILKNANNENTFFSLIDVFHQAETNIDSQQWNIDYHQEKCKELLLLDCEKKITIDVSLHENAGASREQQLAFALLKAKEIIELSNKNSLQQLLFRFAVGHYYFLEIAKLRAFKILFHNLCLELDCHDIPYLFVESSQRYFAKNDEENNLIRSTLALSAAMIGGADALYSSNYKVSNPNDLSREISFKQQIVLAYESIINVFPDASSGSYYIEEISKQMAEYAWKLFVDLEAKGGYLQLLYSNNIQEMVYQTAILEQDKIDSGEMTLIGVNLYPKLEIKKQNNQLYHNNFLKKTRLSEKYED